MNSYMEVYLFTMVLCFAIVFGFWLWLYTKPGKKWLENM
ncbi:unknown [Prevotella sp. CAG:732]|nr:unknown [Prevotella sp. CAG:732]